MYGKRFVADNFMSDSGDSGFTEFELSKSDCTCSIYVLVNKKIKKCNFQVVNRLFSLSLLITLVNTIFCAKDLTTILG